MTNQGTDTALILTSFAEQMNAQLVLGTGGWIPPGEREALDWMTFIAMMGWKVKLQSPQSLQASDFEEEQIKWLILTGDPDMITGDIWEQLLFIGKIKKIVFITRAGKTTGWLSKRFGVQLSESRLYKDPIEYHRQGCSKQWKLRGVVRLPQLDINAGADKLAMIADGCIVASADNSGGKILFLSFHPSEARDAQPVFTALLKQLLIYESLYPVAWFDLENTLILRMDDPGSGQAVHDNSFCTTKLAEEEWSMIGQELSKRKARMSLAYVPAWVDDGNSSRGELEVAGQTVSRSPGNIYPSPLVKYSKAIGNGSRQVFDYTAEFRAIQNLRNRGLVEVELHGYTHMHPDRDAWKEATDKYENKMWFREFGKSSVDFINSLPKEEHPLLLGIEAFRNNFHSLPSTLIFPGEAFTHSVLEIAMKTTLKLVSSYYLGIRIGHQLCWNQHVCSPYLDLADAHWFDQELPVVGYFHDFDVSKHGINWFAQQLDAWQQAGANFFIDFRELTVILSHTISIREKNGQYQLNFNSDTDLPYIKPIRIGVYIPAKNFTSKFTVNKKQETHIINLPGLEATS